MTPVCDRAWKPVLQCMTPELDCHGIGFTGELSGAGCLGRFRLLPGQQGGRDAGCHRADQPAALCRVIGHQVRQNGIAKPGVVGDIRTMFGNDAAQDVFDSDIHAGSCMSCLSGPVRLADGAGLPVSGQPPDTR